jgi:cathepsin B
MLGTIMPGEEGYSMPLLEKTHWETADAAIPKSFDAREQWSGCAEVIGRVRDQSNCGSCWAFGSTEALNDRHCITTGKKEIVLSAEDTLACCSGLKCQGSMGCNGGQPAGAWDWFTKTGVTTGKDWADVGAGDSCKPYSMESCAHHVSPPEGMKSCTELPTYKTPSCTSSCSEKNYATAYKNDKFFAKSSYSVSSKSTKDKETSMQKELMEKGTVSVALSVYEDFETYSSGVYKHVTGKYLGGHAVKMIGWGEENGTKYWLCVNSWNQYWGDNGTFKILRGSDECGIESSVVAGDV